MANLKIAVQLADIAFIYDAPEVGQGAYLLVAMCEKEQTSLLAKSRQHGLIECFSSDKNKHLAQALQAVNLSRNST